MQDRLKLLLLYGQILIIDHLLASTDAEHMFSIIEQAQQIAETAQDQQGNADALSLHGQAHYFASLNTLVSPDSSQEDGKFDAALADQQQALKLWEALHDTRGISESHFLIGVVYERWQQHTVAVQYYARAWEVAEAAGHRYELAEPARHLAFHTFRIQGYWDRALVYALQALSFREEAQFKPYLPLDHALLSDTYLKQGDTANALLHIQKASVIASEMGYKRMLSQCQVSLGDIQLALHEEAQAQIAYKQALLLTQEAGIPMSIARANERLERLRKATE